MWGVLFGCCLIGVTAASELKLGHKDVPAFYDVSDFCQEVAEAATTSNGDYILRHLLIESTKDSVTGADVSAFEEQVWKGVFSSLHDKAAVKWQPMPPLENGYDRCLIYSGNSEDEDGGLKVIQVSLRRVKDGFRITDWFNYTTGFSLAKFARLAFEAWSDSHLTTTVPSLGQVKLNSYQVYLAFSQALKGQSVQRLQETFAQLPDRHQRNPLYLSLYANALYSMNAVDAWQAALESLEQQVGDDPVYSMTLLDYSYLKGDYDGALHRLKQMRELVGDLQALDMISVMLEQKRGRPDAVLASLGQAIKRHPNDETFYWLTLDHFVAAGQYQDATLVLDALRGLFGYEFKPKAIKTGAEYAAFAKSDIYKTWYKANKSKP